MLACYHHTATVSDGACKSLLICGTDSSCASLLIHVLEMVVLSTLLWVVVLAASKVSNAAGWEHVALILLLSVMLVVELLSILLGLVLSLFLVDEVGTLSLGEPVGFTTSESGDGLLGEAVAHFLA